MKNKVLLIIAICSLLLCVVALSYQKYYLNRYNSDDIKINHQALYHESIIVKKRNPNYYNSLTYKNLQIEIDFPKYKLTSQNEQIVKYSAYDTNNTEIASIWIGQDTDYLTLISTIKNINGHKPVVEEADFIKFYQDNNITNDLELFSFIKNYQSSKINVFTSVYKMKEHYIVQLIKSTLSVPAKSITPLTGNITGYIFEIGKNTKEVSILHGKKRYILTLSGEHFTKEHIIELLGSITFTN